MAKPPGDAGGELLAHRGTLVAWRLASVSALSSGAHAPAYAWGFAMLAAMYALLFVGAMNLPARSEDAAKPAAR